MFELETLVRKDMYHLYSSMCAALRCLCRHNVGTATVGGVHWVWILLEIAIRTA